MPTGRDGCSDRTWYAMRLPSGDHVGCASAGPEVSVMRVFAATSNTTIDPRWTAAICLPFGETVMLPLEAGAPHSARILPWRSNEVSCRCRPGGPPRPLPPGWSINDPGGGAAAVAAALASEL